MDVLAKFQLCSGGDYKRKEECHIQYLLCSCGECSDGDLGVGLGKPPWEDRHGKEGAALGASRLDTHTHTSPAPATWVKKEHAGSWGLVLQRHGASTRRLAYQTLDHRKWSNDQRLSRGGAWGKD